MTLSYCCLNMFCTKYTNTAVSYKECGKGRWEHKAGSMQTVELGPLYLFCTQRATPDTVLRLNADMKKCVGLNMSGFFVSRQMLVFRRSVVIIKGPGSCQVQKIKRLIRTEKQEKWKAEIDDIGCCSSYPCFLSSGLGTGNIGDTSHSLPRGSTNIIDLNK